MKLFKRNEHPAMDDTPLPYICKCAPSASVAGIWVVYKTNVDVHISVLDTLLVRIDMNDVDYLCV